MTAPYVLALDEGTTNAKALAVAADGTVLAAGSAPVPVSYPQPGWVEQDAEDIWRAQSAAIAACLDGVEGAPEGIAISNQRESVVCWDARSGRALGPVLGWQDSRTAEFCDWLRSPEREFSVAATTGLSLDPMFSAPKMRYLLDRVGAAMPDDARHARIGTIDAWLVARLSGQDSYVIEAGNASRTLLMDLATLQWSEEMCALFGVPAARLPRIVASNADFGATAGLDVLPDGVPIVGVLGDSHAALFGHGCRTTSEGKATYGTGSSVMVPSGADRSVRPGVSTTLAWLTDRPMYGHEGNIVASGTAMDWTARLLGVAPGRALDELSYRESALQLSVVAQHNFYSFDFSVMEVVLMGRSPHKRLLDRDNAGDYEIARRALATVGMEHCAERNFSSLSGGEQQRVILARALTQEAECMILDEPTNHLDIKYQLQIMDIVRGLDLTVAAAIHDLNIAALYCDRLIAIKQGRVVGLGTPAQLLTEEFIHDLYEVHSKVERDDSGRIYIRYLPQYNVK